MNKPKYSGYMTTEENKREEAYASTHKVLTYKDILGHERYSHSGNNE